MTQLNLADLYLKYLDANKDTPQAKSNLNTALFKYTLPGLGFVIPKRSLKKFNSYDIKLAQEFAAQFEISDRLIQKMTDSQEEIFTKKNINKANARTQRKVLKKFLNFCNQYIKSPTVEKKEIRPLRNKVKDLSDVENARKKRKNKSSIILTLDASKYSSDVDKNKLELERINLELKNFAVFLKTIHNSEASTKANLRIARIILGWQYIKTGLLNKVGLDKLISKFDFNVMAGEEESYSEYCMRAIKAQEKSKNLSKKNINFIRSFFEEYKVSDNGRITYINTCINIAKFLYKDITDIEEYDNYSDISVIRRLRILRCRLPKTNSKILEYLPSWEIIINCLNELKNRADVIKMINGKKRKKLHIAKDLQRFLILAMFTLVPPPRQRVVRELKIDSTLKHGLFGETNVFIPYDKLENKSSAKYYIHLQPEDYKTGSKYGEWLGELPNCTFPDKKTFYQYLDKWLYEGYREEVLGEEEDHGFLFLRAISKKPLSTNDIGSIIRRIFLSTIKLSISPHKLRTIYRTYLEDIGVSQQVLNSSAFWMRHSPQVAKDIYTRQTMEKKLKYGSEKVTEISEQLFALSSNS